MEKITSLQNNKIKRLTKLHTKKGRDEAGLFLVEGEHLIQEAMRAKSLLYVISDECALFQSCEMIEVTPEIMKKLSANVSAVHYIGVCKQIEQEVHDAKRVLMLDGVQDPGNLGTLIRTAVSFGFDAVYCSQQTVDVYNEKVIRSTQGALFYIPVLYVDLHTCVQLLKEDGFQVIGTSLKRAKPMQEIASVEKMAFILGNEGQGVSKKLLDKTDMNLFIEMSGFESLNVAVAGGIIMYQYREL